MAVVIAVALWGMKWTFNYFSNTQPLGPTTSPLVKPTERVLPPGPRLQALPHFELRDYCEAQERQVNTYGWVDRQSGILRVPIDRAMDLTLERGLSARPSIDAPSAPAVAATPPVVSGDSDMRGQCAYVVAEAKRGVASEEKEKSSE
jgi:hypothetical protein